MKGNASKRAMKELFEEEVADNAAESFENADDALRREKLRREMLGDKKPESASVMPRRENDRAMQNPKAQTGTIPRVQTGSIPRVQTGTIPRVQTGSIPRVQTGSIPRVQTGSISRVQTGTIPRVQTGSIPRVQTGTIPRVQTGSIPRVQTGEIDRVKTATFNKVERKIPVADAATKTFKAVEAEKTEEKKTAKKAKRSFPVALVAALSSVFVVMIGVAAVLLILKNRAPEEPVYIPTDVVAGIDETSANFVKADAVVSSLENHTVTFKFYAKPGIVVSTADVKAGELMDELGIEYEKDKVLSVDASSEITKDTEIEIKDVDFETETVEETIANGVVYVDDDTIYQGNEEVAVEGYAGVRTYTYKVRLVNGEEESRELVSEEVTTEPVDRVINRGTKQIPVPPHTNGDVPGTIYTGAPENYLYYVDVRATWYCIEGITATGLPTGYNVMAVDPNVIPLGSECVVIGDLGDYGHRIAADIGGGIKGNIIDIWLPLGDGFTQGWQNARVYVLREGF